LNRIARREPALPPTSDMGTLFKSELMSKCQFFLPPEAAYNCIAELGEIGSVQFVDLNPETSSFQRQFVGDVKRCEEIERKLRYIESEIVREKIEILEDPTNATPAPAPREVTDLETNVTTIEENLKEVSDNFVSLMKNHLELTEIKNMLSKAEVFLNANQLNGAESPEATNNLGFEVLEKGEEQSSMQLNICSGVIDRIRVVAFEKMLWRVSKGNVYVKFADIEEEIKDPKSGEDLIKSVFIIFYQGEALKSKVKKICEGFHASVYPCPDNAEDRRDMMLGVNTRIEDLKIVISQTDDHRQRLLGAAARSLRQNYMMTRKMKSVYYILNHFSLREGQRVLVGQGWMPTADMKDVRAALFKGGENSGSAIPPTLERIPTVEEHPTYHKTNKYTSGYQSLVDAYGVNTYREINPAVYTIATFPFLFAVMFGDAGHGTIMLLFALWMIIKEKQLEKFVETSEIFKIFFGGRYIVLMMSCGSIYTGLIYNDIFAKSFNIFGSHFKITRNFTASIETPLVLTTDFDIDPKDINSYTGTPYPFGIDPVWLTASNSISFLNGYKMKISLIFGVIHMTFGVMLSVWNKVLKRQYHAIILEFFPQIVFLLFIFGYLIVMIFIKWIFYGANKTGQWSEHCAPNLLITFINMMLFKNDPADPNLVECHQDGLESDIFMFRFQGTLQKVLVITGVLMIPIMLLGKPLYILFKRRQRRAHYDSIRDGLLDDGDGSADIEEDGFGEIMINQGIHTIEYVLGSISHTASYLRLWALSLAHNQLSDVLWSLIMANGFSSSYVGAVMLYPIFAAWAALTISVMVLMEGLSAFLHTLRLHWVEFQSKFYEGAGYQFVPFDFKAILKEAAADDKEILKTIGKTTN